MSAEISSMHRAMSREDLSGTTKEQKEAFEKSSGKHNPMPKEMIPPGDADHGCKGD